MKIISNSLTKLLDERLVYFNEVEQFIDNLEDEIFGLSNREFYLKYKGDIKELLDDLDEFHIDLTGFEKIELDSIFFERQLGITDTGVEWQGMPEWDVESPSFRKITVSFQDEKAVSDFFELLGQNFTEKTKQINYPYKPNRNQKNIYFKDADQ